MKPHSRYFACATILRTSFPAIRPFPDPRRVLGLFPHDAHAPGLADGELGTVKKAVIKVKLENS